MAKAPVTNPSKFSAFLKWMHQNYMMVIISSLVVACLVIFGLIAMRAPDINNQKAQKTIAALQQQLKTAQQVNAAHQSKDDSAQWNAVNQKLRSLSDAVAANSGKSINGRVYPKNLPKPQFVKMDAHIEGLYDKAKNSLMTTLPIYISLFLNNATNSEFELIDSSSQSRFRGDTINVSVLADRFDLSKYPNQILQKEFIPQDAFVLTAGLPFEVIPFEKVTTTIQKEGDYLVRISFEIKVGEYFHLFGDDLKTIPVLHPKLEKDDRGIYLRFDIPDDVDLTVQLARHAAQFYKGNIEGSRNELARANAHVESELAKRGVKQDFGFKELERKEFFDRKFDSRNTKVVLKNNETSFHYYQFSNLRSVKQIWEKPEFDKVQLLCWHDGDFSATITFVKRNKKNEEVIVEWDIKYMDAQVFQMVDAKTGEEVIISRQTASEFNEIYNIAYNNPHYRYVAMINKNSIM